MSDNLGENKDSNVNDDGSEKNVMDCECALKKHNGKVAPASLPEPFMRNYSSDEALDK